MDRIFTPATTALLAAILLSSSAGADPKIVEFTAPNAIETNAEGIDARGDVGGYYIDGSFAVHGFVRNTKGHYAVFENGDAAPEPLYMNAHGQTTGFAFASDAYQGFLAAKDGSYTAFSANGTSNYTIGTAIGPKGDVAGTWNGFEGPRHGFLRDVEGTVTLFDCPAHGTSNSFQGTMPSVVTKRGEVYGTCVDGSTVSHGFFRSKAGKFKTIDLPEAGSTGFTGTTLVAVNKKGTLAGVYIDGDGAQHAFLRPRGGDTIAFAPPNLQAGSIAVTGLNRHDVVTGYFSDSHTLTFRGFVRDPDGTITVFDSPSAGSQPSEGTLAQSINDKGEIAGSYTNVNGGGGFLRKP